MAEDESCDAQVECDAQAENANSEVDESLEYKAEDTSNSEANLEAIIESEQDISREKAQAHLLYTTEYLANIRQEQSHNWSIRNWFNYVSRNLKSGANLKDGIKGLWYLLLALTDNRSNKDPINAIEQDNAEIIFLPGLWGIPRNIELLEQQLGKKFAYVESTDPHVIKEVADYMASKRGAVKIIGFSDGGKTIENYISAYGTGNIQSIYAIATNPITVNPTEIGPRRYSHPRLHYYLLNKDLIASLEKGYPENFIGVSCVEVIEGGHAWVSLDKNTAKTIANKIKENSHVGKIYGEPMTVIRSDYVLIPSLIFSPS